MIKKIQIILIILSILVFTCVDKIFAQNVKSSKPKVETLKTQPVKKLSDISFPVPHIPVLKDLNYQPEKSAILNTSNVIIGMLVYKCNYNVKALVEFYKIQMRNQGWTEIGSITASKITLLAFKRPEGSAFISISQGSFTSQLRIMVLYLRKNQSNAVCE